jgi:hypothetical protein
MLRHKESLAQNPLSRYRFEPIQWATAACLKIKMAKLKFSEVLNKYVYCSLAVMCQQLLE